MVQENPAKEEKTCGESFMNKDQPEQKISTQTSVYIYIQGGPLPAISRVTTPISRVITPVTHL